MTGNHQKEKKNKKKRKNKPKNQTQKKTKKNRPKNQKQKKNKKKHLGITRPKTNKPMSKRRRTKYNNKNFHVHYFFTAPKQQSNNAKECQHQNNVARGPGPPGPGPRRPQGPGLGPGPGPRPHYFDVGTLLHCLIAALELCRSSERGSSYK